MVVAGRYVVSTVDRPWLEDKPAVGTVCTALDAILDEPVLIHVADAEASSDVLEAAQRVSILGDPRIAPTLDVGHSNGLDYVVSQRIAVTALGQILPKTPLPVDAAKALIGEIGTVLVTSARRGLFHMFLRPSVVGITSSGGVLVSGIGIDAALALGTGVIDPDDYTPTKASRQDALDLIRLFYAAVTGYWPAEEGMSGVPAAPRENSRIARAKALNPEVPAELDDFISGVLTGHDPGPGSVAEVLGFIDEWDAELLRYVNRTPAAENDKLFDASPASFEEATSLPTAGTPTIGGATTPASEDQVKAALVRIGITRPGTRGLAAGVSGRTTGRYADRMQMRKASSFPIGAEQIDNAAKDWDEWQPEQTYSEYSGYSAHEYDENLTSPILNRDEPEPDTQALDIVALDEAEDENDTRVIIDDEDDGSWFLGGMFETSEQQREHQLREYERERRISKAKEEEARRRLAALEASSAARQEEANAATPPKQMRRLSPETVDDGPTAAGLGAGTAAARSGNGGSGSGGGAGSAGAGASGTGGSPSSGRSPAAGAAAGAGAAGVAGAAAGAGVAAGAGGAGAQPPGGTGAQSPAAGGPGGHGGGAAASSRAVAADEDPQAAKARTRKPFALLVLGLLVVAAVIIGIIVVNLNSGGDEPTAAPASTAPSQPAEEQPTEEPQAEPPVIDKVTALDPQGDDTENDDQAKDVIKGEKGSWRTDRYNSAEFGNLKDGVGLLFEFEKKAPVSEVTVVASTSGGAFEILSGSDPESAKKVGEGEFDDAKDGVTVTLDEGVDTDSLILWVTELPRDDGGYRAVISTVDIT
ncbi:virulence factor MviN [Brevibacterium sp. 2SA]|uniref:virulence factor MviN n=1 Tax=Brevibacterium sp. 2SA TaxID=2502198 RepID=UPI002016A878|nr:virulence factor MviN [Brevibacterium sp. 2SA]